MGLDIPQKEKKKRVKKLTLLENIEFADVQDHRKGWLLIVGNFILCRGTGEPDHATLASIAEGQPIERHDGRGRLALPGAIDVHVHFRDPGLTHKGDFATESRAAIAGGVTSVVDMPNTVPQTTSAEDLAAKNEIAAAKSVANYGFFIGATADNIDRLADIDPATIAGVKLFMGSSTGGMLVSDPTALERLFAVVRLPISIHAEDEAVIARCRAEATERYGDEVPVAAHTDIRPVEACVAATRRAIDLAERHHAHAHIAHLTTGDEVDMIVAARRRGVNVTCEVSPHHLLWCSADYAAKGSRIKMNPSVKSAADRDRLRQAVTAGDIDIIATDHAPHLWAEKQGTALTAASGAPMVQFSLPAMLDLFGAATVCRMMCEAPARLFGIDRRGSLAPGNYADIVLIDRAAPRTITDADVISRCGWTPMDGVTMRHRVAETWVNGQLVYSDGTFADHSAAMPLRFNHQ